MRGFGRDVFLPVLLMVTTGTAVSASPCDKMERTDALNACLGEELQVADKALNSAYVEIRRRLTAERQELLKKAETSWIELRDRDCEFEASAATGGAAYQSLYLSCQIQGTRSRLHLLQDWQKRSL